MKKSLTFVLELTKRCNNNCLYCYNVWKTGKPYPEHEMSAEEWMTVIDKLIAESQPRQFALSGGEPLLNKDFFKIARHLKSKKLPVTLITNGTQLDEKIIKDCLKIGIKNFELPLLGDTPEIHDRLTRNPGSWQKVIESCYLIKKHKGELAIVFVITKQNVNRMRETMEMAIALGADVILANRFNVGGEGIKNKNILAITPHELDLAFKNIDDLAEEYEIQVNSGIPMPPCLLKTDNYKNINFFNCPHGGKNAYYAIDPAGNVRPCNHSALIIGNLLQQMTQELLNSPPNLNYFNGCPTECHDCSQMLVCRGGCRAASEVFYGDTTKQDPFVVDHFQKII